MGLFRRLCSCGGGSTWIICMIRVVRIGGWMILIFRQSANGGISRDGDRGFRKYWVSSASLNAGGEPGENQYQCPVWAGAGEGMVSTAAMMTAILSSAEEPGVGRGSAPRTTAPSSVCHPTSSAPAGVIASISGTSTEVNSKSAWPTIDLGYGVYQGVPSWLSSNNGRRGKGYHPDQEKTQPDFRRNNCLHADEEQIQDCKKFDRRISDNIRRCEMDQLAFPELVVGQQRDQRQRSKVPGETPTVSQSHTTRFEHGYYNFSNIRYARAPVGSLRWAPPQAPVTRIAEDSQISGSGSTMMSSQRGRICPQAGPLWGADAIPASFDYLGIPHIDDPDEGVRNNERKKREMKMKMKSPVNRTNDGDHSSPLGQDRSLAADLLSFLYDTRITEDCLFLDVAVPTEVWKRRLELGSTTRSGAGTSLATKTESVTVTVTKSVFGCVTRTMSLTATETGSFMGAGTRSGASENRVDSQTRCGGKMDQELGKENWDNKGRRLGETTAGGAGSPRLSRPSGGLPLAPSSSPSKLSSEPSPKSSSTPVYMGAPVLVWIHGGGYVFGHKSAVPFPAGLARFKDEPIIFVSINYRLGAFGFLSGPALQASGGVANAGLLDQLFALQWIQRHIHRFGGDATRVTVMGESAGSGSVMHLITAYAGQKGPVPFKHAILQSPGWVPVASAKSQEDVYQRFLEVANVTSLAQAREADSARLQDANFQQVMMSPQGTFTYGPVVDGLLVPALPPVLLGRGQFDKNVHVMAMHNLNEGLLFLPRNVSKMKMEDYLRTVFPRMSSKMIEQVTQVRYPPLEDFGGSKYDETQREDGTGSRFVADANVTNASNTTEKTTFDDDYDNVVDDTDDYDDHDDGDESDDDGDGYDRDDEGEGDNDGNDHHPKAGCDRGEVKGNKTDKSWWTRPYHDEVGRIALAVSEAIFTCNSWHLARAGAKAGRPFWGAEFAVWPGLHGMDLPYTFWVGYDQEDGGDGIGEEEEEFKSEESAVCQRQNGQGKGGQRGEVTEGGLSEEAEEEQGRETGKTPECVKMGRHGESRGCGEQAWARTGEEGVGKDGDVLRDSCGVQKSQTQILRRTPAGHGDWIRGTGGGEMCEKEVRIASRENMGTACAKREEPQVRGGAGEEAKDCEASSDAGRWRGNDSSGRSAEPVGSVRPRMRGLEGRRGDAGSGLIEESCCDPTREHSNDCKSNDINRTSYHKNRGSNNSPRSCDPAEKMSKPGGSKGRSRCRSGGTDENPGVRAMRSQFPYFGALSDEILAPGGCTGAGLGWRTGGAGFEARAGGGGGGRNPGIDSPSYKLAEMEGGEDSYRKRRAMQAAVAGAMQKAISEFVVTGQPGFPEFWPGMRVRVYDDVGGVWMRKGRAKDLAWAHRCEFWGLGLGMRKN